MLRFPEHTGSLTLDHNDNLSCYQTVKEEIERNCHNSFRDENWVSLEEKQKAIDTNELWSFSWHGGKQNLNSFSQKHASSLEALLTHVGGSYEPIEFPEHKASLHLVHNNHFVNYSNVSEEIEDDDLYGDDDWISLEEKHKALETNELWTLQWYPNSPVGFCIYHASTLEALMKVFEEEKDNA